VGCRERKEKRTSLSRMPSPLAPCTLRLSFQVCQNGPAESPPALRCGAGAVVKSSCVRSWCKSLNKHGAAVPQRSSPYIPASTPAARRCMARVRHLVGALDGAHRRPQRHFSCASSLSLTHAPPYTQGRHFTVFSLCGFYTGPLKSGSLSRLLSPLHVNFHGVSDFFRLC